MLKMIFIQESFQKTYEKSRYTMSSVEDYKTCIGIWFCCNFDLANSYLLNQIPIVCIIIILLI